MRRYSVLLGAALVALLALAGAAWAAVGPLAVTKTVPGSGATEVTHTADVEAYFNHDVRRSTVTSSTFKIRKQGSTTWLGATRSVNNAVSPTPTNGRSQSVVTLDPNADLARNTTYQVVIVGGDSGVKDTDGKSLGSSKKWTFTTVDTAPPDTTIDSGPSGHVNSRSATFAFSSNESGSTFECSLDGGTFTGCASPKIVPEEGSLTEGPHTFAVFATDAAGNADPTPDTQTWTVDTVVPAAPTVSLDANSNSGSQNDDITNDSTPTIGGTAEAGSTVKIYDAQNSVVANATIGNDGTWGHTFSALQEGAHSYTVKAVDAAGNESQGTPIGLTIDTLAPNTFIGDKPSAPWANSGTATFTFSSNETATTFECSLDWGSYASCASPKIVPEQGSLSEGQHTFSVFATDAAGNADTLPASWSWIVDTVAPTVSSVSPADAATNVAESTSVTATFSEAMKPASISGQTFTLTPQGSTSPVAAVVSYDSSNANRATLDPSTDLAPNTTYTARLTTGVTDQAGNAMAQEKTWSFRTDANLDGSVTVSPNPLDFGSACRTTVTRSVTLTNVTTAQVDVIPSVTSLAFSVASDELHIAPNQSVVLSISWSAGGAHKQLNTGRLELKDAAGNIMGTGDLRAFVFCPIEG
jgi:hypothetical protein